MFGARMAAARMKRQRDDERGELKQRGRGGAAEVELGQRFPVRRDSRSPCSLHSRKVARAPTRSERLTRGTDPDHGGRTFPHLLPGNSGLCSAQRLSLTSPSTLYSNNSPSRSLRPLSRPLLPTRRSSRPYVANSLSFWVTMTDFAERTRADRGLFFLARRVFPVYRPLSS